MPALEKYGKHCNAAWLVLSIDSIDSSEDAHIPVGINAVRDRYSEDGSIWGHLWHEDSGSTHRR